MQRITGGARGSMAGTLSVLHTTRSAHENEVLQANHEQLEVFVALASSADQKGLLATYVQHKAWTHTAEVERKRVELYMAYTEIMSLQDKANAVVEKDIEVKKILAEARFAADDYLNQVEIAEQQYDDATAAWKEKKVEVKQKYNEAVAKWQADFQSANDDWASSHAQRVSEWKTAAETYKKSFNDARSARVAEKHSVQEQCAVELKARQEDSETQSRERSEEESVISKRLDAAKQEMDIKAARSLKEDLDKLHSAKVDPDFKDDMIRIQEKFRKAMALLEESPLTIDAVKPTPSCPDAPGKPIPHTKPRMNVKKVGPEPERAQLPAIPVDESRVQVLELRDLCNELGFWEGRTNQVSEGIKAHIKFLLQRNDFDTAERAQETWEDIKVCVEMFAGTGGKAAMLVVERIKLEMQKEMEAEQLPAELPLMSMTTQRYASGNIRSSASGNKSMDDQSLTDAILGVRHPATLRKSTNGKNNNGGQTMRQL